MSTRARYITKTGFIAEPGVVLNKQFEILEYVGKGATARVWRARHLLGRFDVAVKLLNTTQHDFNLGREEFHQLSLLYHPNVVRTFGMEFVEGHEQAFITMEYIAGRTLDEMIRDPEHTPGREILVWILQMVDVLQYLHSMRIIHKDVKPQNIIIDEIRLDARAVLIDFNISHLNEPDFGTPAYKSPEVATSGGWSAFADVWALALTFYELLVKREIFKTTTEFGVELEDDCPLGFPKATFDAIKEIVRGNRRETDFDNDYRLLFSLPGDDLHDEELPEQVAVEFNVTSRNQRFLVQAMLDAPHKPRSKDVIIREALHSAERPAGAELMRKMRPVLSQLKARSVLEYAGKGGKKAILTQEFLDAVDRARS